MSKIRNTPHVYSPPLKRVGIKWYPGNAEGFDSRPMPQFEKDRIRAAIASGNQARA